MGPWTINEAREAAHKASLAQQHAEDAMKDAARRFAEGEERYRVALAKEIVRVHAEENVAWSVAGDVARGDPTVARLKRERDIAEGVREAMSQAAWRRTADRKDVQRFADWSQRREFAEAMA